MVEAENSGLVLENEQQRQQYEKCLDQIANQVVQALLAQKVSSPATSYCQWCKRRHVARIKLLKSLFWSRDTWIGGGGGVAKKL